MNTKSAKPAYAVVGSIAQTIRAKSFGRSYTGSSSPMVLLGVLGIRKWLRCRLSKRAHRARYAYVPRGMNATWGIVSPIVGSYTRKYDNKVKSERSKTFPKLFRLGLQSMQGDVPREDIDGRETALVGGKQRV